MLKGHCELRYTFHKLQFFDTKTKTEKGNSDQTWRVKVAHLDHYPVHICFSQVKHFNTSSGSGLALAHRIIIIPVLNLMVMCSTWIWLEVHQGHAFYYLPKLILAQFSLSSHTVQYDIWKGLRDYSGLGQIVEHLAQQSWAASGSVVNHNQFR